jgi:uncharacterized protein (TIGR02145 family)
MLNCNKPGEFYHEVQIGNQVWMRNNLNVTSFRNGDPIPEAKSAKEWAIAGEKMQPAWCYYKNDTRSNRMKFGKLYNYHAIIDSRGLAPLGWRIPSNDDYNKLLEYVDPHADPYAIKFLAIGQGNLPIGFLDSFQCVAAGMRFEKGEFNEDVSIPLNSSFWTSIKLINNEFPTVFTIDTIDENIIYKELAVMGEGHSVRCVKD